MRSHLWLSGWNAVQVDSVDGTTVTLQGPVEAPVLDLAVSRRASRTAAVEALVRTTANGVGIPAREFDQPTVIAQGPEMWEAVVDGDRLSIYGPSYDATVELAPESGPQLRVLRSLGHAFVIATNTWPETGRQIVVSQPGRRRPHRSGSSRSATGRCTRPSWRSIRTSRSRCAGSTPPMRRWRGPAS
ncbi:MAG: hypothetical protein R2713_21925 [Ilumatobacteraceae bacterium]